MSGTWWRRWLDRHGPNQRTSRRPRALVLEDLEARNLLSFTPAVNYSTGHAPFAVINYDLRGVGILDLVEANNDSNTVSVRLGNGDGTFGPRRNYAVGRHPEAIDVADLNGDFIPDLIVANYASNNVTVLYGNGDGTLSSPATWTSARGPNRSPPPISAATATVTTS